MEYKAIVFDLFETLITEWGHKKYTKNEMCSDLGIEREKFDVYWNEKERERYSGEVSFADSIRYVCSLCFEYVNQDVYIIKPSQNDRDAVGHYQ